MQFQHTPKVDESVNSVSGTLEVEEESKDESSFGLGDFFTGITKPPAQLVVFFGVKAFKRLF